MEKKTRANKPKKAVVKSRKQKWDEAKAKKSIIRKQKRDAKILAKLNKKESLLAEDLNRKSRRMKRSMGHYLGKRGHREKMYRKKKVRRLMARKSKKINRRSK